MFGLFVFFLLRCSFLLTSYSRFIQLTPAHTHNLTYNAQIHKHTIAHARTHPDCGGDMAVVGAVAEGLGLCALPDGADALV